MTVFDFDYETRSQVDLTKVGIWNYAQHPSTEIILMSYAFDEGEVKTWEPHISPIPDEVLAAFFDPFLTKRCFNCGFERIITRFILGIDIPICEWRDVQVMSRYFSLPGNLEDVCEILQLSDDVAKLKEGKELIRLFCEPFIEVSESPLFGLSEPFFKDWRTNPAEWERFKTYNQHDVKSQIAIANKLLPFPVPADEWRLWELDQKINDRGLNINLRLIEGAIQVVEREQENLSKELRELTGVDNPNSPIQLLEWMKKEGYPFNALGKAFVDRAINGEGSISEACKQALLLRKQLSKSSVKKLYAIKNNVCTDGRLRHQFVFGGAARTMRWSGRDCQLHNLMRPVKEVEKNMDRAIELLCAADYDGIKREFKSSVLDVATSCIRPTIIASDGKKLVISDFSSIESRVIGLVAGCKRILEVFEKGLDSYKDFATEMFNKPYDQITKEERNQAKAPTLGCGFGLGGGEERIDEKGDLVKTGLIGYAAAMNIEMTVEEAHRAVKLYREKFPEVPRLWKNLDKAALMAVRHKDIRKVGVLTFDGTDERALRMVLPSGRALHYADPLIEEGTYTARNGEIYTKQYVTYMGMSQETRQWVRLQSKPGLWTENSVQAIARDLLAHALLTADKELLYIVGHVHDEAIIEDDVQKTDALDILNKCMRKLPPWAVGLPIHSEGYESHYYTKN